MSEQRITAKQTADVLGLTVTNLKHYAGLLEFNGLEIYRTTRNHREYSQQDVDILRAMIKLNRDRSMPLDECASFVMSSDTDIDAILSLDNATIEANEPEVIRVDANDSVDDSRELAVVQRDLSLALSRLNEMQAELLERDQFRIEYLQSIESKMQEQGGLIEEQSKAIAEQSATIAELHKRLEAESKRSLWSRLFGK